MMHRMGWLVAGSFAFLVLLLGCGSQQSAETVLAEYDGGTLTRGELDDYLAERPADNRRPGRQGKAAEWVEARLLELLTREQLVTDSRRAEARSDEAFLAALEMERERALVTRYLADRQPEPTATPAEIDAFLVEMPDQDGEERRELYHIYLAFPEGAQQVEKDTIRANVARIRSRIEAGASFSDQAKAFSQGPTADRGGYYGVAAREDLPPALAELIFGLEEGELSEVLENQAGVHLFYVERVLAGGPDETAKRDFAKRTILAQKQLAWLRDHLNELLGAKGLSLPDWPRNADPNQRVLFSWGDRSVTTDMIRSRAKNAQQARDVFVQLVSNMVFSETQRELDPEGTEALMAAIERDMILKKALETSLMDHLAEVPEATLRNHYEQYQTRFKSPFVVTMNAASWNRGEGVDQEALAQSVAEYAADLRAGRTPKVEPAQTQTIGPVALPELRRRQPALGNALPDSFSEGQVIGPLALGQSLLVLHVVAAQPPQQLGFEEARPQVAAHYFQVNQQALFQSWTEALQEQSDYSPNHEAIANAAADLSEPSTP